MRSDQWFSTIFIEVETSGAFRLLAESHAVTQGFVLFEMGNNTIFLYMHEKHLLIQVYMHHCNC